MRRAVLPVLALLVLTACGGTAPPASAPTSAPTSVPTPTPTPTSAPPAVGSPLCDDLRTAVQPDAAPDDARAAAARVLELAAGGSEGVLPDDVEAALRERSDGRSPTAEGTSAVQAFVQEECG